MKQRLTPMRWLMVPVLAAAAVAACTGEAPDGVVSRCEDAVGLPPSVSTDILFVVDDSNSMAEEQEKVIAQLNAFVDSLASGPVENDFQVGVVTTSVTSKSSACDGSRVTVQTYETEHGRLQLGKTVDSTGKVVTVGTRKILSASDSDLVAQFSLLIRQGVLGSGQEMGLEAMRLALSPPLISTALDAAPPGNAGFLRPGSRLLVVIVSDEDDCSTEDPEAVTLKPPDCGTQSCTTDSDCGAEGFYCSVPPNTTGSTATTCQENVCETAAGRAKLEPVQTYVDFLKDLKDGTGRERDVSLAVIGAVDAGGQPKRCATANGVAKRYAEAVTLMGERGYISSICDSDYATALQKIAELVGAPQRLDLPGDPGDPNLVRITVHRAGTAIECRQGDGFEYSPPSGSTGVSMLMTGKCRLRNGDELDVKFVCAG